jgi:hypothetical protein
VFATPQPFGAEGTCLRVYRFRLGTRFRRSKSFNPNVTNFGFSGGLLPLRQRYMVSRLTPNASLSAAIVQPLRSNTSIICCIVSISHNRTALCNASSVCECPKHCVDKCLTVQYYGLIAIALPSRPTETPSVSITEP